MSDYWIETRAGKLFARSWPTGPTTEKPPILLLHDSLGCVDLWRDFPARLAAATGRTVLAYDRLGFGRSDARSGRLPTSFVEDEAEVVPQVCDALGARRVVLFGHSVGGGMALAASARRPALIEAVISESAQSFVEERTLSGVRHAQADFEQPAARERLARYHGEKADWVLENWIETWLSPAFADWNLDAVLPDVRCDALILHGDRDEYGSTKQPQRIARLIAGRSQTVVFEGCGHIPHRERPHRVLDAASQFLGANAERRAG